MAILKTCEVMDKNLKNDKMDPELGSWSGSPPHFLEGIEETHKMAFVSCLYLNYIESYRQKRKNDQMDPELWSWSGSPPKFPEGIEETNKMAFVSCLYLKYFPSYGQNGENWKMDPESGSWSGSPPKFNGVVLGPKAVATKNFIKIRPVVLA